MCKNVNLRSFLWTKIEFKFLTTLVICFSIIFQTTTSQTFDIVEERSEIGKNYLELNTCCDLRRGFFGDQKCPNVIKPLEEKEKLKEWTIPSYLTYHQVQKRVKLTTALVSCVKESHSMKYSMKTDNIEFQDDGYLKIGNRMYADYIHPKSYCIDGISETSLYIRSCEASCTKEEPCIRKCCQREEIFDLFERCIPTDRSWTPKLFREPSNPQTLLNISESRHIKPRILVRSPPTWNHNCPVLWGQPQTHVTPYSKDKNVEEILTHDEHFNARMGLDGSVFYRNPWRKWVELGKEEYCGDGMTFTSGATYNDTINESLYIMCAMHHEEELQASRYYAALAIGSSMFALLTVIVYFLLLDKQNIHSWTTMSHSTAVFFLFILLGIAHLTKEDELIHENYPNLCKFVGIAAHYFFIAVFSWLFVLSFDLWLTFRSISMASNKRGLTRFGFYSLFGWGFPFAFVLMSWILNNIYDKDENTTVKVPMYGESFCYISRYSVLEYLYIPTAILFVTNASFFGLTAWTLYRYQQSTKLARKNIQKNRQSFTLFVKLFIVAGMLWIVELLSFSIGGAHTPWYVQILDTLNVFQPILIFIIFVFKHEVINSLHDKYPVLRPVVYPARLLLSLCKDKWSPRGTTVHSETAALNSKNETNISRISKSAEEADSNL